MESIFRIQNLTCEYQSGKPVLHIPDLEIPRGKLIFLVGKSGIGKSTFLETLGVMNNTIRKHPSTKITFNPSIGEAISLESIWEQEVDLVNLRRKHFSFVFQNTNLMNNFSCGENMMVGLLIEGESYANAKKKVLEIMGRLSLEAEIFDKSIQTVSGGQLQRIAFVRAITSDFTVLFGDEPTGNLDFETASELMQELRQHIVNQGKTSIIVSHNTDLAILFGDCIIPVLNSKESPSAHIDETKIINRHAGIWTTAEGNVLTDPKHFLTAQRSHYLVEESFVKVRMTENM